ncbi:MAG: efflux RND transporter permease subunit [Alphaproteobacteria bacterium]
MSVSAKLPGADPETMAATVAAPLERRLGEIAGVAELTSTSGTGSSSITAQFDLDRDINGAAHDVQAAINASGADLPVDLPNPPTYRKVNPADAPVLILAVTSGPDRAELALRRLRFHPRPAHRAGLRRGAGAGQRRRQARRAHRARSRPA